MVLELKLITYIKLCKNLFLKVLEKNCTGFPIKRNTLIERGEVGGAAILSTIFKKSEKKKITKISEL